MKSPGFHGPIMFVCVTNCVGFSPIFLRYISWLAGCGPLRAFWEPCPHRSTLHGVSLVVLFYIEALRTTAIFCSENTDYFTIFSSLAGWGDTCRDSAHPRVARLYRYSTAAPGGIPWDTCFLSFHLQLSHRGAIHVHLTLDIVPVFYIAVY